MEFHPLRWRPASSWLTCVVLPLRALKLVLFECPQNARPAVNLADDLIQSSKSGCVLALAGAGWGSDPAEPALPMGDGPTLGLLHMALSSTRSSLGGGFGGLWKGRYSWAASKLLVVKSSCCGWTALARSLRQTSYFCMSNPETQDGIESLAIRRLCSASKCSYNSAAG